MQVSFEELLKKAQEISGNEKEWHHHYLPSHCLLNTTTKHLIILEYGDTKLESSFDQKPMEYLEKLENLFFKRE